MAIPFNPGASTSQFGVPQSPMGNIQQLGLLSVPVVPASVAAATTVEQTFTVAGVITGDVMFVTKPTAQAGLSIATSRIAATGVIAITYSNTTAVAITPTAETYTMLIARPQPFVVGNLSTTMPLL